MLGIKTTSKPSRLVLLGTLAAASAGGGCIDSDIAYVVGPDGKAKVVHISQAHHYQRYVPEVSSETPKAHEGSGTGPAKSFPSEYLTSQIPHGYISGH